jgi:hypothetical protein
MAGPNAAMLSLDWLRLAVGTRIAGMRRTGTGLQQHEGSTNEIRRPTAFPKADDHKYQQLHITAYFVRERPHVLRETCRSDVINLTLSFSRYRRTGGGRMFCCASWQLTCRAP